MMRAAILGAALFSLSLGPCDKVKALVGGQPATAEPSDTTTMQPAAVISPEDQLLKEATDLCTAGDCLTAHDRLTVGLPAAAPQRQSAAYKDIETKWANATIDGAADDPDLMARRRALGDVIASATVNAATKGRAQQTLAALPLTPIVYDAGPQPKISASATPDDDVKPTGKKPGKKRR